MNIIQKLAQEFNLKDEQVEKTVALIDEGNTIPFIARYRKEVTGSLDDNILRDLNDRLNFLRNIEKRKQEVKDLIADLSKKYPRLKDYTFGAMQRLPLPEWGVVNKEK